MRAGRSTSLLRGHRGHKLGVLIEENFAVRSRDTAMEIICCGNFRVFGRSFWLKIESAAHSPGSNT
jgi:hypothetical protein